ncbi:hypothetical protein N8D56_20165 [Devosia sp. A8/3-2]|nr:hypothetical protein N8D56_20165 [Devosia sp. A8/3-2]
MGDASDRSVIGLFNLTFAGAATGFLTLGLVGYWRLLLVPSMLVVGAIQLWVARANLPYSRWFMPTVFEVALAVIFAVALPLWRPDWFDRSRSLKIFAPAMIVPIALCLRGVVLP